MPEIRKDGSTADHVYSWLCNAIAGGRLRPGEFYSVHQLATELGASRTPVREATLRLAALGVVTIQRNRGFIVEPLTVESVRENYEARILLEVAAARAAAQAQDPVLIDTLRLHLEDMDRYLAESNITAYRERDRSFHNEILSATGNPRIMQLATLLRDSSIQTWGILVIGRSNFRSRSWQQHSRILRAIETGDVDEAGEAAREHLERSALSFMRHVAQLNDEPEPTQFAGALNEVMRASS